MEADVVDAMILLVEMGDESTCLTVSMLAWTTMQ
jgi:hypothetical protein